MKKKLLWLGLVLALAGCSSEPPNIVMEIPAVSKEPGRVQIQRIGTFEDDTAYYGKRGVYVITDTQTGKQFLGVSGVGISETGSHPAGKNQTVSDER